MVDRAAIARENGKKGGRPKGVKNQATLEKEAVKKVVQQKILQAADVLFSAQLHVATGQTFLYKIEKEEIKGPRGGTSYKSLPPKLVTSQIEIENYLMGLIDEDEIDRGPAATYYYMTTKEPNTRAVDSMLDRALDKSTQPIAGDKDNPLQVLHNHIVVKKYGKKDISKPRS